MPLESFSGKFKEECVERHTFKTRDEARQVIFEHLEIFYNRQRKRSSLGYIIPAKYEQMKGEKSTENTDKN